MCRLLGDWTKKKKDISLINNYLKRESLCERPRRHIVYALLKFTWLVVYTALCQLLFSLMSAPLDLIWFDSVGCIRAGGSVGVSEVGRGITHGVHATMHSSEHKHSRLIKYKHKSPTDTEEGIRQFMIATCGIWTDCYQKLAANTNQWWKCSYLS